MKRTPLKRYTPLRTKRPGKPRRGRAQDRKYLAWIRTLPCSVPGCTLREIEPHHAGLHGMGQKCHDRESLPLCPSHHRTGQDSYHGVLAKHFWEFHGIDRTSVIAYLNDLYERSK